MSFPNSVFSPYHPFFLFCLSGTRRLGGREDRSIDQAKKTLFSCPHFPRKRVRRGEEKGVRSKCSSPFSFLTTRQSKGACLLIKIRQTGEIGGYNKEISTKGRGGGGGVLSRTKDPGEKNWHQTFLMTRKSPCIEHTSPSYL